MSGAAAVAFQPKSGVNPSIEEYKAFHGMVCGITSAQRCIGSFDGCALFADRAAYESNKDLAAFDYSWNRLNNIMSYYLLVLISFTGLCTLLGKTQLLVVRDENQLFSKGDGQVVKSESNEHLQVPAKVIDYMIERSRDSSKEPNIVPEIMLNRRFEFNFGNYLSVIMLHFVCSNGKKHLVEVYSSRGAWAIQTVGAAMVKLADLFVVMMKRVQTATGRENPKKD